MKRTQIQLDEQTWGVLRQRAFQRKISIAAMIREIIRSHIFPKQKAKWRLEDFTFIGSGRSRGRGAGRVAERHDEEFVDSLL